jgi:acyl-CoA reductase-like NAD-dependent aldehyde dehydrogenase
MTFKDEEELLHMANDTVYGLAAAVWSSDEEKALRVGRRIRAGTIWINDFHMLTTYAPRGGYKQSGFGRELGEEGLYEYLQTKHYFVNKSGEVEDTAYALVSAAS